jgi:hypothetical protein
LFEGAETLVEVLTQPELTKPHELLIKLDLSLPIEPQLDNARRLAQARATIQAAKTPIEKFRTYLRLLDFKAEGATHKEIGKHLFHAADGERLRNLIRDNLDAARQWQRKYLLIALHSPAN